MIRMPYSWRTVEGRRYLVPLYYRIKYKIDCFLENLFIKKIALPHFGINTEPREGPFITVSLTTYPERNEAVFYAIKSLMLQSLKADKIVLWLASSQYPNGIPAMFTPLIERGLSVRFCDDLRSHKKYFYALQEQKPNEVVITFDDDIIYESDAIEKLVKAHLQFPDCMICNRVQKIIVDENGLAPYFKWKVYNDVKAYCPTLCLIPSTGAGCLYPYGFVNPSYFDRDRIIDNALTADDLWIGFNNINSRKKVVKTLAHVATLINVKSSQTSSLTSLNDIGGENQRVIVRLLKIFPETLNRLNNQ